MIVIVAFIYVPIANQLRSKLEGTVTWDDIILSCTCNNNGGGGMRTISAPQNPITLDIFYSKSRHGIGSCIRYDSCLKL